MTAVNIVLQPHRAVITTDSLFVDYATGSPRGFADKCVALPELRMAVTCRGDARVPAGVAHGLTLFYDGMDGLLLDEAQAVQDQYDAWVGTFDEVYTAAVEIMIVGWSEEANAPRAIVLQNGSGSWEFSEIDPEEGLAGPLISDQELDRLDALGVGPGTHWDLASYNPVAHGIPFMEAQRRMKHAVLFNPKLGKIHSVGGHILLTEVTDDGVEQRVIHEWPDLPGVPVQPAPFAAPPRLRLVPPANMSRQQRRAWEREHGKVTA